MPKRPRCPICTVPITEAEIICQLCRWERKRTPEQRAADIEAGDAPHPRDVGREAKARAVTKGKRG